MLEIDDINVIYEEVYGKGRENGFIRREGATFLANSVAGLGMFSQLKIRSLC